MVIKFIKPTSNVYGNKYNERRSVILENPTYITTSSGVGETNTLYNNDTLQNRICGSGQFQSYNRVYS